MSNKLVKSKAQEDKITEQQKTIIFVCSLIVLCIAFICVWTDVYNTSNAFKKKTDEMVLGVDYFQEEIEITNKRVETDENDSVHENYFLYYHDGHVNDYNKRMQVSATIYQDYQIGDKIMAYKTNHNDYSYEKYGILPQNDFRNNEIKKVIGVLLGIGILVVLFFRLLDRGL